MKGFGSVAFTNFTLLIALACASRHYVPVAELGRELSNDEVSAVAKYDGQVTGIEGQVTDKGTKRGSIAELSGIALGGSVTGELRSRPRTYGYLVLSDAASPDSKAICFFEPEMLSQAAPVKHGDHVRLRGIFTSIAKTEKHKAAVFSGCTVDD